MDGFNKKLIADAVHGPMGFSELELKLIQAKSYQRLRNIKQLGLAHLVFPGADHSRFSHSIGVCHVTGLILDSLAKYAKVQMDHKAVQSYRLAALLHDIGHYPFSHAVEHAIEDHYRSKILEESQFAGYPLSHEGVSQLILRKDAEINSLIEDAGYSVDLICSIFSSDRIGQELPEFCNIVSSELDADRIDYMLRAAHQSGLPYGSVDLPYLLRQFRVDENRKICLTVKSVRTADHFLLCRYFDYQQIAFHKSVASLEWALQQVVLILLDREYVSASGADIELMVQKDLWKDFDESTILDAITKLRSKSLDDQTTLSFCDAVLKRNPPKLLAEIESVEEFGDDGDGEVGGIQSRDKYNEYKRQIMDKLHGWAAQSGISSKLWYVRAPKPLTVTKTGTYWGESELDDQSIRIVESNGLKSRLLIHHGSSLMSRLCDLALYSIRVYVLAPYGVDESAINVCRRRIRADLPKLPWK